MPAAPRPAPRPTGPRPAGGHGGPGTVDPAEASSKGGSIGAGTVLLGTFAFALILSGGAAWYAQPNGTPDRTQLKLIPGELLISQDAALNVGALTENQLTALKEAHELTDFGVQVAGTLPGAERVSAELAEHRDTVANLLRRLGVEQPPVYGPELFKLADYADDEVAADALHVLLSERLPETLSHLHQVSEQQSPQVAALADAIQRDVDAYAAGAMTVQSSSTTLSAQDAINLMVFAMRYNDPPDSVTSVTPASWHSSTQSYVVRANATSAPAERPSTSSSAGARTTLVAGHPIAPPGSSV